MNGKTARLINKSAGQITASHHEGSAEIRKPIGRRTKSFWGRIFAAWKELKERSPAIAPPRPIPPTSAIVVMSSHTQSRKSLKRQWGRMTARERFAMRATLTRGLTLTTD